MSIKEAVGQIEKAFGKGSIVKIGSKEIVPVKTISTGSLALDNALGVGGFPRGRIVEIFGPESSGKTTIALETIAEAQAQGGEAAIIDAEHALDPAYARRIGVDLDAIWISQPDYGEQALEIAEYLLKSNEIDVLVIDSVAALVPKAELDGDMSDNQMGLQARLMSKAMRKLAGVVAKTDTVLIFINQLREKIGVMFGSPETTTGGKALKFYASVRVDVRKRQLIKDGDGVVIGATTHAKVIKNKVSAPFREADFDLLYNKGISMEGDIVELGVTTGVIEKAGSWFSYGGERLGQGKDNVVALLEQDKQLSAKLEAEVRQQLLPTEAHES